MVMKMNTFEALEWMTNNKICICGGTLKEISESELRCQKCGLTIRILKKEGDSDATN